MLQTIPLHTRTVPPALWTKSPVPKIAASVFTQQLLHRSVLSYRIPSERVRALVPTEFELAQWTMLSIESFLDNGLSRAEQTNYRLHVQRAGQPCSWLLGTSLGSLSGVTARHLYSLPWHLSAMEFQIAFDASTEKYQQYRLRTQSQWANADWEIVDTGLPLETEPATTITDYFVRRDGAIGSYHSNYQTTIATRGKLKAGRCDRLAMLGLLSQAEQQTPISVLLQRAARCEIKPATQPLPAVV